MGSNPAPCSRANSLIERAYVTTLPPCDSRSLATGSSGFGCIVTSPFCGPVDSVGRTFTSHTHNVRLRAGQLATDLRLIASRTRCRSSCAHPQSTMVRPDDDLGTPAGVESVDRTRRRMHLRQRGSGP